ncbi:MAG: AmmeMemoRadiSam system radical SAM enzyme [Synergistales bacterium]|nr:AmmeMemoRadiSam system radical SAM enzyme [Synergistales bacterium]
MVCRLCPHACRLAPGETGVCRVRMSPSSGELKSCNYAKASSISLDPMEKKPLYHFYPGEEVLSLGTVGCNMACPFCQNWEIATWSPQVQLTHLSVDEVLRHVRSKGLRSVAFTYNEPFVWYEFVYDCAQALREEGCETILVTNGYINSEPLETLLPHITAANVDLKAFTEEAYRRLGGSLEPVQQTIRRFADSDTHLEVTHLLVPGINDSRAEFAAMIQWIAALSPAIPFHLSRSFPRYHWDGESPSVETMNEYSDLASEYLAYVYLGNMRGKSSTYCRGCGREIVARDNLAVRELHIDESGQCAYCGRENNFVTAPG